MLITRPFINLMAFCSQFPHVSQDLNGIPHKARREGGLLLREKESHPDSRCQQRRQSTSQEGLWDCTIERKVGGA